MTSQLARCKKKELIIVYYGVARRGETDIRRVKGLNAISNSADGKLATATDCDGWPLRSQQIRYICMYNTVTLRL